MPYVGKTPVIGNFQKCDAIAVVNGQAAYTLQVGGSNVSPQSENHMLVSLNGILQAPTDSFTVSGSTLTFASNLVTGDVIDFVMILGNVLDLGVPSDNTVTTAKLADSSVSLAKLTATGTKDATTFLRGDNTFATAGGTNTPSFFAKITSNTSLTVNTSQLITFPSEDFDTDSAYDTSNGKFTVPSGKAGKYFIYSQLCVDAQSDSELKSANLYLYKNGSALRISNNNWQTNYPKRHNVTLSTIEDLSVGDYLEIYLYVEDAVDTTMQIQTVSSQASYFTGYKIIE